MLVLGGGAVVILWFSRLWLRKAAILRQVEYDLQQHGVTAQAKVMDRRIENRLATQTSRWYVTYQYSAASPDGTMMSLMSEDAIYASDYMHLHVGDLLTVRYLPDHPETVRIESGARELYTAWMWHLNSILAMVGGVLTAILGAGLFVGLTIHDSQVAATATAQMQQWLATPDSVRATATAQSASATRQADIAALGPIQQALAAREVEWRKVQDKMMHHVLPPESDLEMYKWIDYGYCDSNHFYTYVWLKSEIRDLGKYYFVTYDGVGYVEGAEPKECYPKELGEVWSRDSGALGDGWYAVSGGRDVQKVK